MIVINAEKLMGLIQKKKKYKTTIIIVQYELILYILKYYK